MEDRWLSLDGPGFGSMIGPYPGDRAHVDPDHRKNPHGARPDAEPLVAGAYDIEFDFLEHRLHIRSSNGTSAFVGLGAKSVAEFHSEVFEALGRLGIEASIRGIPNEVDPAIPFAEDHQHASYDPEAVGMWNRRFDSAKRTWLR